MPGPVLLSDASTPPVAEKGKPLVQIPGDEDQARGYRVKRWRQYPNYCCIYCQYATLWIEKMEKHQAEGEHPWAFPGQNPRKEGDVGPATPEY